MFIFKRILAISFIFVFTSIAWIILGATIFQRTYDQEGTLHSRVSSTWGTAQVQEPPTAAFERMVQEFRETDDRGRTLNQMVTVRKSIYLPLESTRASAEPGVSSEGPALVQHLQSRFRRGIPLPQ